jgi:hypothetical protein
MTAEVAEVPVAPSAVQDELPISEESVDALEIAPEDKLTVQSHDEIDRLDPLPEKLKFLNGTEFTVNPLRLRQFLALLRILTRSASSYLQAGGLNARDPEEFARQLMMLLLLSFPESEEETIEFVKTIVSPVLTTNPEIDDKIQTETDEYLNNPELEDIVLIFQALVEHEADDLRRLGNRLRSMMSTVTKMGILNRQNNKAA